MNNEERNGKRQHVARRKTAEVRRFSDERLEQFEKEKARREGEDNNFRGDRKPFGDRKSFGDRKPFGERRSFGRRDDDRDEHRERGERKPFDRSERRSFSRRDDEHEEHRERKSFDRDHKPFDRDRKPFDRDRKPFDRDRKPFDKDRKPFGRRRDDDEEREERKPFNRRTLNREEREERGGRKSFGRKFDRDAERPRGGRRGYRREKDPEFDRPQATGEIRLNKYLADAGICSRREADDLILAGAVTVNGEVVTELGTKVKTTDKVIYGGQTLNREKLRYVLLNKPKGVITTSDDPYERHTVMELVEGACDERIYPVGRLDRNTLGLLLLTNDGDLAKTLTHPSHEVKKLYHVTLNKPLTTKDFEQIQNGLMLEDGPIQVDKLDYVVDDPTMREIGVEIHSGRNHIVRRIFESLGYEVLKLDRVMLAGLTKQNLPRGHWRFLTSAEISMLKRIE